ncbi:MAG: diguanylate cyclase [Spirochaetes bacterium]|nr:diguanylate cyclase [Spirochaetota bacterium]
MLVTNQRTEEIRRNILESLKDDNLFEENILQNITRFPVETPDEIYSHLFYVLCDISLSVEDAKRHYEEISNYRLSMERALKRKVRFRVAMLDYFMNNEHVLENPKIVEIKIYELKTKLALIDPLTELYNRRYIEEYLPKEINRSSRHGLNFCVLFMDIDDFKSVNDTHGHHVGDDVLRAIGSIISAAIRVEDVGGRYGGEEFLVIMPETEIEGAKIFANRLLEKIRAHAFPHNMTVTVSGGIASFPMHGSTAKEILEKADKALYYSKYTGKDRVNIFSIERRYHFRYDVKLDVVYSFQGAIINKTTTVNLSVSGISFETERQFTLGDMLDITVLLPQNSETCIFRGRVVWIKEMRFEKYYRVGLAFQDLSDEMIKKLKSILKDLYGNTHDRSHIAP